MLAPNTDIPPNPQQNYIIMTELETKIWNTVHNWCDAQSSAIPDQNRRYLMDEIKALVLLYSIPTVVGQSEQFYCNCSRAKGLDYDDDGMPYCIECQKPVQ